MDMENLPSRQRINKCDCLGIRPLCPCCGGGDVRGKPGKYSCTKSKSRWKNVKSRRSKPKQKDHR